MTTDVYPAIERAISIQNLGPAMKQILILFPRHSTFIGLSGQWTDLEDGFREGAIREDIFTANRINFRKSLLHFISKLPVKDQDRLLQVLAGEGNEEAADARHPLKIAYIESTPKGTPSLQTGFEYKQLGEALRKGKHASGYELLPILFSATLTDLITAFLVSQPEIIHFSGHAGKNGLVISDEQNELAVLSNQALGLVFKTIQPVYKNTNRAIELIFLNACHSEDQVKSISPYCNYSIGMNDLIPDREALIFSTHFYGFLGNFQSPDIPTCFASAIAVLRQSVGEGSIIPQLWIGDTKWTG